MSKKLCSSSECLHHDVVEEHILGRLPLKTLMKCKAVSKQWKSTIESRFFHERVWKHRRQQSGDPDVLFVSACSDPPHTELLRTLVLGGSSSLVNIPTPWETQNTQYLASGNSCDGLVCLYRHKESGFVVNPTTRWYRPLPLCGLQQLIIDLGETYSKLGHKLFKLGFGKDIFTGTYKAVWLYNSSELGLENATTCEVFDFSTRTWRYVTPASPYRVVGLTDPVFVDGSLHWFTECEETKIVSFDLHTEAFQVISKAPFANSSPSEIFMCNLDNRLCVSQSKIGMDYQVIWSFNSSNKTWDQICSIDLYICQMFFDVSTRCVLHPLALLDGDKKKKTKKLLFSDHESPRTLLTLDPELKSEDPVSEGISEAFWEHSIRFPVCYFPSLFSIQ